jgi:hypothetical protein
MYDYKKSDEPDVAGTPDIWHLCIENIGKSCFLEGGFYRMNVSYPSLNILIMNDYPVFSGFELFILSSTNRMI